VNDGWISSHPWNHHIGGPLNSLGGSAVHVRSQDPPAQRGLYFGSKTIFIPLSENDIFLPSRCMSFFNSYCAFFALIIPYFAFILPFYVLFSLFLSPFFIFLPLSFFVFYISPPFSLPLFILFPPNDMADIPSPQNTKRLSTLGKQY
jgi:hypothetical protein